MQNRLPHPLPLHHIALKVRDLAASEQFYREVLGLPLLRQWQDASGKPRATWLALESGILMLEITQTATATVPATPFHCDPPGWHVVAFAITTEDREAWETYFDTMGILIVHETPYSFYIQDPESNRIGFSHYPEAVA